MADKKLTPMMELFNDIEKHMQFTKKYKANFLKKERQMVIDAYHNGQKQVVVAINKRYDLSNTMKEIEKIDNGLEPNEEAEQYYNETFKTK